MSTVYNQSCMYQANNCQYAPYTQSFPHHPPNSQFIPGNNISFHNYIDPLYCNVDDSGVVQQVCLDLLCHDAPYDQTTSECSTEQCLKRETAKPTCQDENGQTANTSTIMPPQMTTDNVNKINGEIVNESAHSPLSSASRVSSGYSSELSSYSSAARPKQGKHLYD